MAGCPHKLSSHDIHVALWHLANGDSTTTSNLQHVYFPQVNVTTVKQALWEQGLHPYFKVSVPFISNKNIHVQKLWVEEHYPKLDGSYLLRWVKFSPVWIGWHTKIEWCWRKPEQRLDPRFTKKKLKHGGRKVTVWGWSQHLGLDASYASRET